MTETYWKRRTENALHLLTFKNAAACKQIPNTQFGIYSFIFSYIVRNIMASFLELS